MAVLDPQAAIDAAQPWCCVPAGDLWLGVLAALLDVANGESVPMTANELNDQIACLKCSIQPGDIPLLILGAVSNITSGGGGGTGGPGIVGTGSPEGVVTAPVGTSYFNSATNSFWYKKTGAGNTGWAQLLA